MKKKWLGYASFILFMWCFIFAGKLCFDILNENVRRTFMHLSLYLLLGIDILFYIGFGFVMGLGNFIKEKGKTGKWRINFGKLTIIGIPSLVFAFFVHIVMMFNIPIGGFIVKGEHIYMSLFKILLGYTLITSFYKEDSAERI